LVSLVSFFACAVAPPAPEPSILIRQLQLTDKSKLAADQPGNIRANPRKSAAILDSERQFSPVPTFCQSFSSLTCILTSESPNWLMQLGDLLIGHLAGPALGMM